MRVRLATLVMGGLAAATLAASFAAPDAFASAQQPAAHAVSHAAKRSVTAHWCLLASPHSCLESNGTSAQITITEQAGLYSNWTEIVPGMNELMLQNGAGNCMRAKNDKSVVITNGSCTSSDPAEIWSSDGDAHFFNNAHRTWGMLVFGPDNHPLWAEPIGQAGTYSRWADS